MQRRPILIRMYNKRSSRDRPLSVFGVEHNNGHRTWVCLFIVAESNAAHKLRDTARVGPNQAMPVKPIASKRN